MIITDVREYIHTQDMIREGDSILAAFSGGPDSTALLVVLDDLADELEVKIKAAHINHNLRENSNSDTNFCRKFCKKRNIPFYSASINIPEEGSSLEAKARRKRYQALKEIGRESSCNVIATGHNMNDQAETFLLNLLRGSAMPGLASIYPVKDSDDHKIIRPLLAISAERIKNYLKKKNITYRTDPSNKNLRFARNKLRLEILPELREHYNPNLIETLAGNADIIRSENDLIDKISRDKFNETATKKNERLYLEIESLKTCHMAVKRRVLRRAVRDIKGDIREIGRNHIEDILSVIKKNAGEKYLHLPGGVRVRRDYDNICLYMEKDSDKQFSEYDFCYEVEPPGEIKINELEESYQFKRGGNLDLKNIAERSNLKHRIFVDASRCGKTFKIRTRRKGDRITNLNAPGEKKLKDFFIDRKIPRFRRESLPVILTAEEIVWIPGKAFGDNFKITENTEEIIKIIRIEDGKGNSN